MKKKLIFSIIRTYFYFLGGFCFMYLCVYPAYSFFIKKKVEMQFPSGIEIVNYSSFAFSMLWMLLGVGAMTFIVIKREQKKEKEVKETTEKQEIVA